MQDEYDDSVRAQSQDSEVDLMGAFTALFVVVVLFAGIIFLALWAFTGY